MKTKMLSKKIGYWAGVIVIGTVLGLALQFAKAWTEPTVAPPNQNVGAPINTGNNLQTKQGSLLVGGLGTFYDSYFAAFGGNVGIGTTTPLYKLDVNGDVKGTRLCIGSDCKDAWPGGGTSQWITAGNNIYSGNSGNVGIGTTSPGAKLDVYGNIKLSKIDSINLLSNDGLDCSNRGEIKFFNYAYKEFKAPHRPGNYDMVCFCLQYEVGSYHELSWQCVSGFGGGGTLTSH